MCTCAGGALRLIHTRFLFCHASLRLFASPSIMSMLDTIRQRIEERFHPTSLSVTSGADSKYHVAIVSADFQGVPLITRHRMVNDLFEKELLSGEIHALNISAKPPPA